MFLNEIKIPTKEDFFKISPYSEGSERSYPTLFFWRNTPLHKYFWWHGKLGIFSGADGFLQYPIGMQSSPEELLEYWNYACSCGLNPTCIYDAPINYLELYPQTSKFFDVERNPDWFDYTYSLEKLSTLSGEKLRKKRNLIKNFQIENPNWRVENICRENIADVEDFMLYFAADAEKQAVKIAFENFEYLELGGIVLRTQESRIVAVEVWSKISPKTYCIHFEKSDKSVKGSSQMIVYLAALKLLSLGAVTMNREQDMGLENLRKAKRSLDPQMYERLILKPKKNETNKTA